VPAGTDVHAAADGVVIYAGGADKGFGNLLVVSHRDGFVTVYGHMSVILVKAMDAVRRGQVIAKSGASGEAGEPQLHFEIRKDAAPLDPTPLLPRG
jgi:murein DD-endopeptidase MepM/ murein hydrolase activator NlpD